ncbi:MAG: hypothetical protein HQK62_08740 [Desulfamplus sp.]|nr:hypothetical protein [Desulfamplus sp.]
MGKTLTFQVVNNKMFFKCHACQSKRMISVAPGLRTRSMRCHKCGEITRSLLNRRVLPRESQSGTVQLRTIDGSEISVHLYDLSGYGVGFDLSSRDVAKIAVGREIYLKCSWNPMLLSQKRYIVKSIKGQRVGAEVQH